MPFAIPPKPIPKSLRLHEAAARIVELEPSLDITEVLKRLCELVASGDLPARSEFQKPGDELTFSAERARRAGSLGRPFPETMLLWLDSGAVINRTEGVIIVENPRGQVALNPLPWVELEDVLRHFEVPSQAPKEEAPALEVAPSEKTLEQKSATNKLKVPTEQLEAWYENRLKNWLPEKNPPSSEEDWVAAKAQFPEFRVTRDQVLGRDYGVRPKLAPPAWKAPGRRPDFQDPDKLAEKLAIKLADKPPKK
jgi:hypothetical protein